jgi:hypothetical protein
VDFADAGFNIRLAAMVDDPSEVGAECFNIILKKSI